MIRAGLLLLCLLATPAWAVQPDEMLPDPAQEARAQALGKELRCLVCQSESIEESHADLARDLRLVVRERISSGDSDEEVLAYLTDRYGDYVRLRPQFAGSTLWLWLAGPALLLVGAAIALGFVLKGRNDVTSALSHDEEERLSKLLKDDPPA